MRRETDWQRQTRIEREEVEKARITSDLTQRYGDYLGMVLYEYAYRSHTDTVGRDGSRRIFAQVLESQVSSGFPGDRIRAIELLLEAFEAQLAPIASDAHEAHLASEPI